MIEIFTELLIPTEIEENWQKIINLLAEITEVPAALIMRLVGADIQVFTASTNPDNPYHPGDKELFLDSGLYCETVINSGNRLLVPDALSDPAWNNNPDIKLGMISYLGFPVLLPTGKPFGTICVLDRKSNSYSATTINLMNQLKDLIESHLEMLYVNQRLGDKNRSLMDYLEELQTLRGMVSICSHCKSIQDKQGEWRPIENLLIRHPEADFSHGLCPDCMALHYPEPEEQP